MSRSRLPSLLWLAFAVGLSACAHYTAKPLEPTQTLGEWEARSLSDPLLRAFVVANAPKLAEKWPPTSWDVATLTLVALYFHPSLAVARAQMSTARAGIISAGARPNPALGFTPTYAADPALGLSPWILGLTFDLPIETAGKRGLRLAVARHRIDAASLHGTEIAWQVRHRVRTSLVELQAATQSANILRRQQALQNQTVALLAARLQAGQRSRTEVQLVRVAAARTALDLSEAHKQISQARVRLAEALGLPVKAIADIALSYSTLNPLPIAEVGTSRRETLLNRTDVLGALAEYAASQSALQLEISKQYPDLNLGPGYAWDQGENKFSLGVSLSLPLFNHNEGPIAEAEAHRHEAAAAFTAVQARAIAEIDAAVAGYRDALSKLATADRLLNDQRERMNSVQALFAAGAADRVELLQAQTELGLQALARAQTLAEAQLALGQLDAALQRPAATTDTPEIAGAVINPEAE